MEESSFKAMPKSKKKTRQNNFTDECQLGIWDGLEPIGVCVCAI